MKLLITFLLIIGVCLPFHNYSHAATTDIMKLSEVKAGMEGVGRTVFKGTRIETFKFKVLGILEKFAPNKNLIIVELEAPVLTEAGIIAGMSGSPVYINGKVVGAVAYGFRFSKRPIGGVTPIEEIIDTDNFNRSNVSVDLSNIKLDFQKENLRSISARVHKELIARATTTPHETLTPIKLVGASKNMTRSSLEPLSPMFSMVGSFRADAQRGQAAVANDGSQNERNEKNKKKDKPFNPNHKLDPSLFHLSPADAVAIPLIRGDFEFSSSGTVTYVKDNKAYLFGHPYFNLGAVEFPLHKAEIISVVPSFQESFKMAATRNMIGTVIQDRFSAVQAELGRVPYMIPMKVFLPDKNRSFRLEMISHPLLTPVLGGLAISNIFSAQYKEFGFQTLQVKGQIFIEKEKNIIIDDVFSGPGAARELSDLMLAVNFFLMNNPDKNIKIQKIDFEIKTAEQAKNARIANVIVDKQAYNPGELINLSIELKMQRGETKTEQLQIKAPNLKAGSTFYVMVADRNAIIRMENQNLKTAFFPVKLNQLIRAINNLRKNSRIYIKLMTPTDGVFIKGHEYSNLPSSLQNVFIYNTRDAAQARIKLSTITEYQFPVPAVVSGNKLFKLKIKERSDRDVQ